MEERGYTWFGEVLYRILKERGASQSALAREARERGLDYRQNSVSNWMRCTRRSAGAAYANGGALRPERPGVDRARAGFRLRPARQEEGSWGPPRFQDAIQIFLHRTRRAVLRGEDNRGLTYLRPFPTAPFVGQSPSIVPQEPEEPEEDLRPRSALRGGQGPLRAGCGLAVPHGREVGSPGDRIPLRVHV